MASASKIERQVADLLERAAHPTTPAEEARTSATIAARLWKQHGLSCSTPFDRDAFARDVRARCLAEKPLVPPYQRTPKEDPWEKWIYFGAGAFLTGTFVVFGRAIYQTVTKKDDEAPRAPASPTAPAPAPAPAPKAAPKPSSERMVLVEQGDSPWRIALRLGAAGRRSWWPEFQAANPTKRVVGGRWESLVRGERLRVPSEWGSGDIINNVAMVFGMTPPIDETYADDGPFAS